MGGYMSKANRRVFGSTISDYEYGWTSLVLLKNWTNKDLTLSIVEKISNVGSCGCCNIVTVVG